MILGLSPRYTDSPAPLFTAECELTGGWASSTVTAPSPCIQQAVSWQGAEPSATVTAPSSCIQQGGSWQGLSACYCDRPVPLHTAGCELTGVEPPATVTGSHPCIPQVVDRGWAPATVTARLLAYSRVWVDRGWASATVSARPFHTTCVSWQGLSHLLRWQPRPLHTAGCELTGVEPPATVRAPHPCIQQGVSWPGLSSCYCDSPPPCIQRVWVDRGWAPCYGDSPVPLHISVCGLTGLSPCYCDSPSPCIQQGVSWQAVEPLRPWQPRPLA